MIDTAQRTKTADLLPNDQYTNIAAVNSAAIAVDTKDFMKERALISIANEDAGGDTTVSVEHSDSSGSGFAAVGANLLTDPATGENATFDNLNTAGKQKLAIDLNKTRRYVRIQVATAFGSATALSAELIGCYVDTPAS